MVQLMLKGKRSFDDIYTDFYFSLLSLTLKRNVIGKKILKTLNVMEYFPHIQKVEYEDIDAQYSLINGVLREF